MKSLDLVCSELKENSYYVVNVILYKGNVEHKAILYTGYKTGSYRTILNASYEEQITSIAYPDIKVEVLEEIKILNTDH